MIRAIKLAALAFAATLAGLATFTGTAGATTNMTIMPGRAISLTPSGKFTFDMEGRVIICNLTMRGTMTTARTAIAGGTMGAISEGRMGECNGEVTIERLLFGAEPWLITSNRILGTLPEAITGLDFTVRSFKFGLTAFFGIVGCLWEGNMRLLARLARVGAARYGMNTARADETSRFDFISGSEICALSGRVSASFAMTAQTITVA